MLVESSYGNLLDILTTSSSPMTLEKPIAGYFGYREGVELSEKEIC